LNVGVDIGLGPLSIQTNVGPIPLSFGGDVIFRFPILMDGKLTPYAGGGAYYVEDIFTSFTWTHTAIPGLFVVGKGGIEYKLTDDFLVYGGYGYYIGFGNIPDLGMYTFRGGSGYEAGVRMLKM